MKKLYVKDFTKRKKFSSFEFYRLLYKSVYKNSYLPIYYRFFALKFLQKHGYYKSSTMISNRCLITNRGRSILPNFGLSRIMVRQLALKNKLIGVKKSSW